MPNQTNDLTLFSEFLRTHSERANHDSSNYDFLNNSSRAAAANVRRLVMEWSQNFSIDLDFYMRFTSKDNQEHKAAFFEIVMHEWLRRQDFNVAFQELQEGSSRRPDFTVCQGNQKIFISECTLSALPGTDFGIEKLEHQITDIIESIPSPDYFVTVDFEESSSITIAKRKIIQFVEKVISEGDPIQGSIMSRRKWILEESGWVIKFALLKKSKSSDRTLGGVMHGGAEFINSIRPLRTALDRKRGGNYGNQKLPFVVFINSSDFFLDELDIMNTLFGTADSACFLDGSQSRDSFFNSFGKPQNKRVSGVLIAGGLVPWNLHTVKLCLWHNPWAINPLNPRMLNVDQVVFKSLGQTHYQRERIVGKNLGDVLSIDPSYLVD